MEICNIEYDSKRKSRFAFWFVFSFVLNGYATGISWLSLGSAVLIILIMSSILRNIHKRKMIVEKGIMCFALLITATSFLGSCFVSFSAPQMSIPFTSMVVGLAKFWLWALMSSIVVKDQYDKEIMLKWLVRFAIILTTYLIIQNIAFYVAGVYLPNIFRFGPLQPYDEGYANYERIASASILRAGSFLSESSFYGNFMICTLALYLDKFVKELRGKKLLCVLYMALGVVLCGSTAAIIVIAGIFFLYYRRVNSSIRWQIGFMIIVAAMIIVVAWPQLMGTNLGVSLQYAFNKFSYLSTSSRFGKSFGYLNLFPEALLVLGTGLGTDSALVRLLSGSESVYLNSVTSLIIQSGYVGFFLFLILVISIFLKAYRQKNLAVECMLIAYVIKGFASGIYFSTYGVLFMFIIIGQLLWKEPALYEE